MRKSVLRRVLLIIVGIICCFALFTVAVGCDLSGSGDDSDNSDDSNGDSDDSDDTDEWADLQIFYDQEPAKNITDVGFAGGAGPFTVPSPDDWGDGDCAGAFIEITIENTSGAAVDLFLGLTDSEPMGSAHVVLTVEAGKTSKATYLIRLGAAEGDELYWWHDDGEGSNDLSGVTITADIRYWLWNVV